MKETVMATGKILTLFKSYRNSKTVGGSATGQEGVAPPTNTDTRYCLNWMEVCYVERSRDGQTHIHFTSGRQITVAASYDSVTATAQKMWAQYGKKNP